MLPTTVPKVPLESADGDVAESVRASLRERVSSPCGEDGEGEPAGHPPGVGGCAALCPSSNKNTYLAIFKEIAFRSAIFATDLRHTTKREGDTSVTVVTSNIFLAVSKKKETAK